MIVLTVRVVVAVARVAEFISREEHGGPAAAHQDGTGVFDHSEAQGEDFEIIGIALCSAVPAVVVVVAVGVVPAVRLIVLFVVAVQVIERKSVVTGQEVDGCIAAPVDGIIEIRRAGHPLCGDPRHLGVSF